MGKTVEELSESFGVSKSTIKRWFKDHPSFWAAVSRGREQADAKVAEGLFKRATGFEIDSEKHFVVNTGDFKQKVETVPTKTYFPPDPGAAMNWLKNRQPEKWRDKQEHQLTGDLTFTLNLDGDAPKEPESE